MLGVERTVVPFERFGMLGVVWVGENVEEALVSWEAADVLGRAAALDVGEAGIEVPRIGLDPVLGGDAVLPAVAEVVEVADGGAVCGLYGIVDRSLERGDARCETSLTRSRQ